MADPRKSPDDPKPKVDEQPIGDPPLPEIEDDDHAPKASHRRETAPRRDNGDD